MKQMQKKLREFNVFTRFLSAIVFCVGTSMYAPPPPPVLVQDITVQDISPEEKVMFEFVSLMHSEKFDLKTGLFFKNVDEKHVKQKALEFFNTVEKKIMSQDQKAEITEKAISFIADTATQWPFIRQALSGLTYAQIIARELNFQLKTQVTYASILECVEQQERIFKDNPLPTYRDANGALYQKYVTYVVQQEVNKLLEQKAPAQTEQGSPVVSGPSGQPGVIGAGLPTTSGQPGVVPSTLQVTSGEKVILPTGVPGVGPSGQPGGTEASSFKVSTVSGGGSSDQSGSQQGDQLGFDYNQPQSRTRKTVFEQEEVREEKIHPAFAADVASVGMDLAREMWSKGYDSKKNQDVLKALRELSEQDSAQAELYRRMLNYIQLEQGPHAMAYLKGYVQNCIWQLEEQQNQATLGMSKKSAAASGKVERMIAVLKVAGANV